MPSKSAPAVHALWSPKGYTVGLSALPNFTTIPKMLCEMGRTDALPLPGSLGEAFPILAPPPLLAGDFFFFPVLGGGTFIGFGRRLLGRATPDPQLLKDLVGPVWLWVPHIFSRRFCREKRCM